jgi:hypothetical protein
VFVTQNPDPKRCPCRGRGEYYVVEETQRASFVRGNVIRIEDIAASTKRTLVECRYHSRAGAGTSDDRGILYAMGISPE